MGVKKSSASGTTTLWKVLQVTSFASRSRIIIIIIMLTNAEGAVVGVRQRHWKG